MSVFRSRKARLAAGAAALSTLAVVAVTAVPHATGAARVERPAVAHTTGSSIGRPIPLIQVSTGKIFRGRASAPPPSTAYYEPAQFQAAYDLAPLYAKGDEGKGSTIVIVDAFGSTTIQSDLKAFDTAFKLPAPPSFKIITPEGKPGANSSWQVETTLDVEYSHAIAPQANIILVETPVNETEGTAGFKQIVAAENYVISNEKTLGITGGVVISQSFGATEQTFGTNFASVIDQYRSAYVAAQKANVTVLGASGDDGATDCSNVSCSAVYNKRVNSWPSSDPLVTSVGGLHLSISATSPYKQTKAPVVWNETLVGAGGGGDSAAFPAQSFESGVSSVVGSWRGTPDISMSASTSGGAMLYVAGAWEPVGGTSEATPEFAGIVAIADEVAGKGLGDLNAALYAMGAAKDAGLVDVTSGNNSFDGVTGYTAAKGYDMASGWGTVNANLFIPELVAAVAKAG